MNIREGGDMDTIIVCNALVRASAVYPLVAVPVAAFGAVMLWMMMAGAA